MLAQKLAINSVIVIAGLLSIGNAFAEERSGSSAVGKFLITPQCACLPPMVSLPLKLASTKADADSGTTTWPKKSAAQDECNKALPDVQSKKRDEVNGRVLDEVSKACINYTKVVDPDCGDKAKTCKAVDTSGYSLDEIKVDGITCIVARAENKQFYWTIAGQAKYSGTVDVLCNP